MSFSFLRRSMLWGRGGQGGPSEECEQDRQEREAGQRALSGDAGRRVVGWQAEGGLPGTGWGWQGGCVTGEGLLPKQGMTPPGEPGLNGTCWWPQGAPVVIEVGSGSKGAPVWFL